MGRSFEVRPDGTIVAMSIEDAIALSQRFRELSNQPQPAPAARLAAQSQPAPAVEPTLTAPVPPVERGPVQPSLLRLSTRRRSPSADEARDRAHRLLVAIADAGSEGIPSATLAVKMGIQNAKGLSAILQTARRLIEAKGVTVDDVMHQERDADGNRLWRVDAPALKRHGVLPEG